MKIKPFGDRILVERVGAENKYEGLLVIPDGLEEVPDEGTIIGVGPGVDDTRLTVGQKVFISRHFGHDIRIEDRNYILVRQPEILALSM